MLKLGSIKILMQKLKEKLMRFDVWGETTRKKKKERKQTRQTNEKTDIWSQLVKEPHWFSVGMCRLRRTKRLQHLICDIVLLQKALSLSPLLSSHVSLSHLSLSVSGSSLATAVHKLWSMAELCHRIVNLADSAVCPMTNNKRAWPPITMRDARAGQPIRAST